jgi:hypothetical protein
LRAECLIVGRAEHSDVADRIGGQYLRQTVLSAPSGPKNISDCVLFSVEWGSRELRKAMSRSNNQAPPKPEPLFDDKTTSITDPDEQLC